MPLMVCVCVCVCVCGSLQDYQVACGQRHKVILSVCSRGRHTQSSDYVELKGAAATLCDATVYRHFGAASYHFLKYSISLASDT